MLLLLGGDIVLQEWILLYCPHYVYKKQRRPGWKFCVVVERREIVTQEMSDDLRCLFPSLPTDGHRCGNLRINSSLNHIGLSDLLFCQYSLEKV